MAMGFKKILIAVDNSIYSEKAAKIGYQMAAKFEAVVALTNIIVPVPITVNPEMTLAPAFMDVYENNEKNSMALLKAFEKKYAKGIATVQVNSINSPVDGIIEEAKKWNADLIVIGTHGRTGLNHFFMGSVAEHVTRQSACPVLIVPNKEV
jgi:nucleotide-binding universal stress UspA family protein